MNLFYEFTRQELHLGNLANFQMLFGVERLKAMAVEDPIAILGMRGSLTLLCEDAPEGVPAYECPKVRRMLVRLFDETPIALLAAPNSLMTDELFWATLSDHTRVKYTVFDDDSIVYTAWQKSRWKHVQRFRTKILEAGAVLGIPESYCIEHFAKLISSIYSSAHDFQPEF